MKLKTFCFLSVSFFSQLGSAANVSVTVSTTAKEGPLFSINSGLQANPTFSTSVIADDALAISADGTVVQPGRDIIEYIESNGLRYPLGHKGSFWDPDYWEGDGYKFLNYHPFSTKDPETGYFDITETNSQGGTVTAFPSGYFDDTEPYFLDTNKLTHGIAKNNTTLKEDLQSVVDLALDSDMSVTFICNMITPGADYFAAKGFITIPSGKTTPARDPAATYPANPYDLPADAQDDSITPDPDPWWEMMKRRAAACIYMLEMAHDPDPTDFDPDPDNGLPYDRMRVELGNEFFHPEYQYINETFPADLSKWGSASGTIYQITDELDARDDASVNFQDVSQRFKYGDFETDTTSLAYNMRTNYLEVGKYAFDYNDNLGSYTGNDHTYDDRFHDFEILMRLIPPTDDYAYAAIYFADVIKKKVSSDIETGIPKSTALKGYWKAVDWTGNVSWSVNNRRVTYWDQIIQNKIAALEPDFPRAADDPGVNDPNTVLIDALVEHPYVNTETVCQGSALKTWDADTVRDILDNPVDDPMGILVGTIKAKRQNMREGDISCVPYSGTADSSNELYPGDTNDQCDYPLALPSWHTEYSLNWRGFFTKPGKVFETAGASSPMIGDDALASGTAMSIDAIDFDNSWAMALGRAYLIDLLLSENDIQIDALHYFDNSALVPIGGQLLNSTNGIEVDSVIDPSGEMLKLWNRAAKDSDSRYKLTFPSAPLLPYSKGSLNAGCATQAAVEPSLYGWKFEDTDSDIVRYIVLNMSADDHTVTSGELKEHSRRVTQIYNATSYLSGSKINHGADTDTIPHSFYGDDDDLLLPARSISLIEPCDPLSTDSDSDGVGDYCDLFPNEDAASVDQDGDGLVDVWQVPNSEGCQSNDTQCGTSMYLDDDNGQWPDSDGDGVADNLDAFPNENAASLDADSDGLVDIWQVPNSRGCLKDATYCGPDMLLDNDDGDDDNDGTEDHEDVLPKSNLASLDTDGDGWPDSWNVPNPLGCTSTQPSCGPTYKLDVFPNDPNEWQDTDGDGVGDNADVYPTEDAAAVDSDGDGYVDVWIVPNSRSCQAGWVNCGSVMKRDIFPNDSDEWADSDGDLVGDNADVYPTEDAAAVDSDGDGYVDAWIVPNSRSCQAGWISCGPVMKRDVFPNDPSEWQDTDGDGVGNNADAYPTEDAAAVDSDGDGYVDAWIVPNSRSCQAGWVNCGPMEKDYCPSDPNKHSLPCS